MANTLLNSETDSNQTAVAKHTNSIMFGVYAAGIAILVELIIWLLNREAFASNKLAMIPGIAALVLVILSPIRQRKELGGYISFGQAFMACIITGAVSLLIYYVWVYLLWNFIDPGLPALAYDNFMDVKDKYGDMFGDSVKKGMANVTPESLKQTPAKIGTGVLTGLVWWAIVGSVVAALVRRAQPLILPVSETGSGNVTMPPDVRIS